MIQTENFIINGVSFVRTWSDANRYVVRDVISYSEAMDPAEFGRVYTEGDIIVEEDNETQQEVATLQSIIGGERAKRPYEPGEYITIDGTLYVVVLPIPTDGRITIGTNVEPTTVVEEIAKLNAKTSEQ